ncbi:pfkB family carbohydrate kinase, partial [Medicago truncatula]
VKFTNVSAHTGIFLLLRENIEVLGGGGLVDDDNTHTVQADNKDGAPPVSMPYSCSFNTHIQASNGFAGNLRNTKANNDGVPPVSRPYKLPDFPITEGCSKTSGLVVCFGELLIDYIAIHEPFGRCRRDLGGAIANVAVGISKLGGSSAFMSKVNK